MRNLIIVLSVVLVLSVQAYGCQFDTDCNPGSVCAKSGFNLYGACVGGMQPGNTNDQVPVTNPFVPKYGNTCSFDLDCGIGHSCLKTGYSIYGTCM